MKDATKEGLHIKCQKEDKEFFTAKKERKFWEMNLLGTSSAKSLLCTMYFYSILLQLTSLFNAAFHEGTFQNCKGDDTNGRDRRLKPLVLSRP